MMWRMMNGWGFGIGGFIGGIVWMIIEIVLVVVAIYFIVSLLHGTRNGYRKSDAMEILRERYARGEINEEEYLERKKRLEEK